MRRSLLACCLLLAATRPGAATPPATILSNGPPLTAAQELANTTTVLDFHVMWFGEQQVQQAADRYLATDFRNHDVEEPSGAQVFANYFLDPVAYGDPHPPARRTGPLPAAARRRLFAITQGDLTLMVYPNGGGDPGARFGSNLFEIRNGRITQMWYSGPTNFAMPPGGPAGPGSKPPPIAFPTVPDDLTPWYRQAPQTIGSATIVIPSGEAPAAVRDANKALVVRFLTDFFVHGSDAAAARDLAPDIVSHVPGVGSNGGFALVARKHPDKVTAPDPQTMLFALAQGDLVAIGFPVPYAGDPGAWYATDIVRVRDGRIAEWWYSGYPAGRPNHVWHMPDRVR